MAGGANREYRIGVTADTSLAKAAIADLLNSLKTVMNQGDLSQGLNRELTAAAAAAKEIANHLNKATNSTTGKLDMSAFNKSLASSNTSLLTLTNNLLLAGRTGLNAFNLLSTAIATADAPIKKLNGTLASALTTLKNTVKWQLSSQLVHGIQSTMSGAISYVEDLNKSLTNISVVTGQSTTEMAKFAEQANKAAQSLSTTTKAYADAALIYYQLGDNSTMAAKKAEITTKAAATAFSASAKEMSQMLTAVWNSYNVGEDQLQRYVDVMTALGQATASSSEEIMTAMLKVAATANTVGVSVEQMSAMIATVSSTTRLSAESIGTSMQTILSRIGGLKLGQTLEDGVDLNKYSTGLKAIGVNVLDAAGELRNMGDVITELMGKWQQLSTAQLSATAQLIGGARQYTTIMALMSNASKYLKNLAVAQGSEGTLNKQFSLYEKGLEATKKRYKAATEELYSSLINDQGLKAWTEGLTTVVKEITNITNALGGLPGIITTISSLFVSKFSGELGAGFDNLLNKVTLFNEGLTKGKGFLGSLTSITSSEIQKYLSNLDMLKLGNLLQRDMIGTDIRERSWSQESKKDYAQAQEETIKRSDNLIKAREDLLKNSKHMSQDQINNAQEQLRTQGELLTNLQQQKATYGDMVASMEKATTSGKDMLENTKALSDQNETVLELFQRVRELNEEITLTAKSTNPLTLETTKREISSTMSDIFKYTDSTGGTSDLYMQSITSTSKAIGAGEDAVIALNNALASTDSNGSTAVVALQTFADTLEAAKFDQQATDVRAIAEAIDKTGSVAQVTKEDIEKVGGALSSVLETSDLQNLIFSAAGLGDAFKAVADNAQAAGGQIVVLNVNLLNFDENAQRIKINASNTSQAFLIMTKAAMQSVMMFLRMSNLILNWDKMDWSAKITQIGTLVVPVIVTAFRAIQIAGTAAGVGIQAAFGWISIVMLALSAIFAVAIANSEKAAKQAKALSESYQKLAEKKAESVKSYKEETDNINQTYAAYKKANEERKKTGEITEDFTNAVDSVLDALDSENSKIYLLSGSYDTLAESIRNAAQAKEEYNARQSNEDTEAAISALLNSVNGYNIEGSSALGGKLLSTKTTSYFSTSDPNAVKSSIASGEYVENVPLATVVAMLRNAEVNDDFILQLENAYDSIVNRGNSLSDSGMSEALGFTQYGVPGWTIDFDYGTNSFQLENTSSEALEWDSTVQANPTKSVVIPKFATGKKAFDTYGAQGYESWNEFLLGEFGGNITSDDNGNLYFPNTEEAWIALYSGLKRMSQSSSPYHELYGEGQFSDLFDIASAFGGEFLTLHQTNLPTQINPILNKLNLDQTTMSPAEVEAAVISLLTETGKYNPDIDSINTVRSAIGSYYSTYGLTSNNRAALRYVAGASNLSTYEAMYGQLAAADLEAAFLSGELGNIVDIFSNISDITSLGYDKGLSAIQIARNASRKSALATPQIEANRSLIGLSDNAFLEVYKLIGTFDTKPENLTTAQTLFLSFYSGDTGTINDAALYTQMWNEFINSDATHQREMLEAMAEQMSEVRVASQELALTALQTIIDENESTWRNQAIADMLDATQEIFNETSYLDDLELVYDSGNMTWGEAKGQGKTVGRTFIRDDETGLKNLLLARKTLLTKSDELKTKKDELDEKLAKNEITQDEYDSAISDIDAQITKIDAYLTDLSALDEVINDESSAKSSILTMNTSGVTTHRELRPHEKISNLQGLLSKTNLETADWLTLQDATGMTYEQLSAQGINNNATARQVFLLEQMKKLRSQMITAEQRDALLAQLRKAGAPTEAIEGYTKWAEEKVVSQTTLDETDEAIALLENYTMAVTNYTNTLNEANVSVNTMSAALTALGNIDLTNLATIPQEGTVAFTLLKTAIEAIGDESVTKAFDTLTDVGSSYTEKLKAQTDINSALYDEQYENYETLRNQAQEQLDALGPWENLTTDEQRTQYTYWQGQVIENENKMASAQNSKQKSMDAYYNSLASYYKQQIDYESLIAQKQQERETNAKKAQADLASSLAQDAQSGILSQDSQNALQKYIALAGIAGLEVENLAEQWANAKTSLDRFKIASNAAFQGFIGQAEQYDTTLAKTGEAIAKINNEGTWDAWDQSYASIFSGNSIEQINMQVEGWISAIQDADLQSVMQTAWSNVSIVAGDTAQDIKAKFITALTETANSAEISLTDLATEFGTSMSSIVSTQLSLEQSAAEAVAQVWTNAFNTIKSVRSSIFNGTDQTSMIAQDTKTAFAMWQGYKQNNENATVDSFLSAARAGQLSADNYDYATMMPQLVAAERERLGLNNLNAYYQYTPGGYNGMDAIRAATARDAGLTYTTGSTNITTKTDDQGNTTYTYNKKTYSADEFMSALASGEISGAEVDKATMNSFLSSVWGTTLSSTEYTPLSGRSLSELISAALSGDQGAITELIAALGDADNAIAAWSQAVLESTAAAERLAKVQKESEKYGTYANNASRIASVRASYEQSDHKLSWEDYAALQGLLSSEITLGTALSAQELYGNAASWYDQLAKSWTAAANAELEGKSFFERLGIMANYDSQYNQNMRQARTSRQNAAAARGQGEQAEQTEDQKKLENQMAAADRLQTRLSSLVELGQTMRSNYESFLKTGTLTADVAQRLLAVGKDPTTIRTAELYKTAMKELTDAQTALNDSYKEQMQTYSTGKNGYQSTMFDNITSTMTFDEWLDTLDDTLRAWAESDSALLGYFNDYIAGLQAAETAQLGLSTDAIELGVNISAAMARATAEATKLEKAYNKVAGIGNELMSSLEKGLLESATARKLSQIGLTEQWKGAENVLGRAQVAALAQAKEALMQIDYLSAQNAGALNLRNVLGLEQIETGLNNATMLRSVTPLALSFMTAFGEGLKNTNDAQQAFLEVLASPAFKTLPPETLNAMQSAFSTAISRVGSEADATTYWNAFVTACQEAGDDANEVIGAVITGLDDAWASTISSIVSAEQAAAAEVLSIWLSTFETIAAMHEAAFTGKTISSALDSADDYINAFLQSGATNAQEFAKFIGLSGSAAQEKVSDLSLELPTQQEMATSLNGLAAFVDWNEDGTLAGIYDSWEAVQTAVTQNLKESAGSVDEFVEGMSDELVTSLRQAGYAVDKTAKTITDANGHQIESMEELANMFTEQDWKNLWASLFAIPEMYRQKAIEQNGTDMQLRITGGALPQKVELNGETYSDMTSLRQAYDTKWQSGDAALLEKAMGLTSLGQFGVKGQSTEGILTPQEWTRLQELGATTTDLAATVHQNYLDLTELVEKLTQLVAEETRAQIGEGTDQYGNKVSVDTGTARTLTEGETMLADEAIMESGEVAKIISELAVLNIQTAADATVQAAQDALNGLTDNTQTALNNAAEALGKTRKELEEYELAIATTEGTTESFNQMVAENPVLMANAAVEYDLATQAVKALDNALKATSGAFAILASATSTLEQLTKAYEDLRDAVNNYFKANEVSSDFVKENLKDIKDWANGSLEAMERLEKKILTLLLEKMFNGTSRSVDLCADKIDELNKIGNKLKFGERLLREDVSALIRLQRELDRSTADMTDLADTMGIAMDYTLRATMTAAEYVAQFDSLADANTILADMGLLVQKVGDAYEYVATNAEGAAALGQSIDFLAISDAAAAQGIEIPVEYLIENPDAITKNLDLKGSITYTVIPPGDPTMEEIEGKNSIDMPMKSKVTVSIPSGTSETGTAEGTLQGDGKTVLSVPKFPQGTGTRPGGGGGCFVAGTLIATINGYKKIEEIQKGDIVLSYNEQYQHNEYSKVVQIMIHHIATAIYTLYIDNDKLQVTGIHRFYINRNNQYLWVHAYDLLVSDLVLFADGTWHLISNIVHNFKIETVYNFEVSNNHNYYVGRNRILVHNKGGGGCFVAGTPVMMGGYYLNIEKIKPGDLVLSYDEYTKTNTYSKVLLTMIHIVYDDIYTLYTGNDKLVVTGIHRFYILRDDKIEWIAASDLQIGDKVLFANNTWHVIYQIDVKKQFISVYNFEVSNTHNYYVGYDQILAHNKGGGRRERRSRDKTHKDNYEKTRYHDTDRAMTIQGDKLSKLNKLKSFKYGGDYLAALKKENQELSKQIGLNTKKIKEAKEFADIDKKRLQNLSKLGVNFEYIDDDGNLQKGNFKGAEVHFDNDGNLDYKRYQDDMYKKYLEMIDKWNSLSADEQEKLQGYYDAWFDQWKKELDTTVENYEEAQDRIREAQEAILDNIATMSANTLEAIQYTVELKLDTTDFDRKYEDLIQKKLSRLSIFSKDKNSKSTSFAQLAASLLSQMEALVADITTYQLEQADLEGKNKLYHLFRDQYKSDEKWAQAINDSNRLKTLKDKKNRTKEEEEELKKLEDAGVTTLLAEVQSSWLTDADYQTALTQVRDGILNAASAIEDLQASYDAMYSNIWAAYDQDYDRFKTVMDHKKSLIDSFLGMLELMGEGENYDLQMQLYAQRANIQYNNESGKNNVNKLNMTFGDITFAQLQLDLMQKKLEDFKKAHGGDAFDIGNLSEQEKNDYLDLLDRVNDAQDQLLTSTQETLDALRGMYEAQVNKIADEFESQVVAMFTASMGEAGKAISSFQDIADEYAWYNEEQERYLNTSKLLYEVSKLNRLINDSLADMTTKASKERLVALQEEIKALQKKGDLTEYDIKQMQLQYELALALDDLENAQNDKTTVRLVRDDEGNMGYQYTADEDKVSEAQLNYEDKLQAINDLATERVKELEQGYVDTMNEYYTKAREIATMYSDDEETRTAKLQELYAKYQEKLNYYNQQYANATGHLIENQTVIFNHYGETGRDAAEGINTSLQSIITTFNEPGGLNSVMADFGTKLQEAMASYGSAVAAVNKQIGGTNGLLAMTQLASETSDEMEGNVRRLNTALNEQMRALATTQRRWEEYKRTLLDALRQAEDTARAINDLKRAAADEAAEDADAGKKYHVIGTNPESNRIEEYGNGRGYKKESDAQRAKENAERKAKWTGVVITKYESGGLADKTGPAWLDGTLNKPEYVLDAEDTQKMFEAVASVKNLDVEYIEDLLSSLQMAASAMIMGIGGGMLAASYSTIKNDNNTIQLHIEINADFPNATSQSEIIAAFEELSTLASQYVSKGQ